MHIHSLTKHSVGCGENRSKAPPILSISNRSTWVVCFTSRWLYPREKNSRNTGLDCGWSPGLDWRSSKIKNAWSLPGTTPWSSST